ncbi:MAG: A/G-specific adenine glycosylase [Candidatus Uhrbacteria bacterium]
MNWSPLLRWYSTHKRDLPWRRTHDPYRILVSEIMLQQTQVSHVLEFYKNWLKQFPTWHALSRASNAEVIHAWAGLGYNRRGLMLRDIAKEIIAHGIPKTEADWQKLKGIGPYTSAAVSAFAQGQHTIPIDTNIRRVLARITLGKPFPTLLDDAQLTRLVGPQKPELWQATFDLAVDVCKKIPNCTVCPLRSQCFASKKFLSGRVRIPKQSIKKAVEKKYRDKPFPDRIYRGRILNIVRQGSVPLAKLGPLVDSSFKLQDSSWIKRMIIRMEKDGLIRMEKSSVKLF